MDEARKQNCTDDVNREDASLNSIVPADPNVPYDMKEIIERVVDGGYFFEVMQNFAKNIIIGFARMGGRSVGIVANQPAYLAGVLDIESKPLHPLLRLLQHSADYIRRRTGFPAGLHPREQRHHPPRSQNCVCFC